MREVLDTLAAAYAESGRFDAAVRSAGKAVELAEGLGNRQLAAEIRQRLQSYQAGKPCVRAGGVEGRALMRRVATL